ncbi:MAG: DUF7309 domain-containing protein [Sarcina sp.]
MRKEATIEEWKKLYDIAIKIKELKPWEYLGDLDLIEVKSEKESNICSIMGSNSEAFGVMAYLGMEAIHDFFYMIDNVDDIPGEQMLRYQNCIACNFGNRDEVSSRDYKIIKELGLKFRGKNNWIFFTSYEKGYEPFSLSREEVLKMTVILEQVYISTEAIMNGLKVDFEEGEIILRRFDKKRKVWITQISCIEDFSFSYPVPCLEDEVLVQRMKKRPSTDGALALDIAYLPVPIENKKDSKSKLLSMAIMIDVESGMIISQDTLDINDNDVDSIFNMLIPYILEVGKPEMIIVRDEYIASIICNLCENLEIGLDLSPMLGSIDDFISSFLGFGM